MRLESNTIGHIDNPTEEDIRRSFLDKEWADVAGNIYGLYRDDHYTLHSISGHQYQHFSLSLSRKNLFSKTCKITFSRDQVMEYFIRFYQGELSWVDELDWENN